MTITAKRIDHVKMRQILVLASPVLVIFLGNAAARLFSVIQSQWAWVGVSLVYWGSLTVILALFGAKARLPHWFARSYGGPAWIVLALLLGLIAFPLLLIPNAGLLARLPGLTVLWFFWGMVNATLEETYWRAFLLDETANLPRAFGVLYSTVLFSLLHPMMLGVISKIQAFDPANPMAFLPFGIVLFILSLAYSLIYLRTKSLRLPVLSHYLSDLGNLSIFVFMNLVVMGS